VLALLTLSAFRPPGSDVDGKAGGSLLLASVPDCLLRDKPTPPLKEWCAPQVLTSCATACRDSACAREDTCCSGNLETGDLCDCSPGSSMWTVAPGIVLAGGSVLLASAAVTFWEPLLTSFLADLWPGAGLTAMEFGVAWAAWYAWQIVLNLCAGRLTHCLVRWDSGRHEAFMSLLWIATCFGWVLVAGAFAMVKLHGPVAAVGGAVLSTLGASLVWSLSMPCLLTVARPLSRSTIERLVPEVWMTSYCLGEALGPAGAGLVTFAATAASKSGALPALADIRAAALVASGAASGVALLLLGATTASVCKQGILRACAQLSIWRGLL